MLVYEHWRGEEITYAALTPLMNNSTETITVVRICEKCILLAVKGELVSSSLETHG
jgi:hypothetical protein